MKYEHVVPGVFEERPNRFIARVRVAGKTEICHVKNTGRLAELLLPGARVYLQKAQNPQRKTGFDLISVYKGDRLVNIDSSAPNKVFREWLCQKQPFGPLQAIKPEVKYGASRLDFYFEAAQGRFYAEVKGVTLEQDGAALFPDAPTPRGVRHLEELGRCRAEGYGAVEAFIIQLEGTRYFAPNAENHPAFAAALRAAKGQGVQLQALYCTATQNSLEVAGTLPVCLPG